MAMAGYQQAQNKQDKQKDRPRRSSCRPSVYLQTYSATGLVANHDAVSVRITNPMPSGTAAGTAPGLDNNDSGNHDDVAAIRTASAHRTAMKTGAAAACDFDDHVGRSLVWCNRQRLCGAGR
jgi:hypothetical protein